MEQESKNIEKEQPKKNIKKDLKRLKLIIMFTSVFYVLIFNHFSSSIKDNTIINKVEINKVIKTAINNNANIDTLDYIIKNAKNYSKIDTRGIINLLLDFNSRKVYKNINLKIVLENLKTKEYLSEKKDKIFLEKIEKLTKELDKVSPLEKLNSNQKEHFNNIAEKLDENSYNLIKKDINKIIDEIHYKNQLIDIYLEKSDSSYNIAWFSLIFSLIGIPAAITFIYNLISKIFFKFKNKNSKNRVNETEES